MKKYFKFIVILFISIFCNSCIIIFPKEKITDNRDKTILVGIQVAINEISRPIGSNLTTIEVYDYSKNGLIFEDKYKWNSINTIKLNNGDYKLITYYPYFKKDRMRTETILKVENNMINIEIDYPLAITTGKAKLKVNGVKVESRINN